MQSNKLGLVICKNYDNELNTVVRGFNNSNIEAFCVQSICLNQNPDDKEVVKEQINSFKQKVNSLNVLMPESCTNCNSGQCQGTCSRCGYHESCLELFAPQEFINQLIEEGYFIVTPGWLANWETIVKNTWKLPEAFAKQFFLDTAKHIGVIDTGVDADCREHLKAFSEFAGLEYRIFAVGLDYFRLKIEKIVREWHYSNEINKAKEANKKVANYTMAFEIIKNISTLSSEKALLNNIFQLFVTLFSPQKLQYTPIRDGAPGNILSFSDMNFQETDFLKKNNTPPNFEVLGAQKGFKVNAVYDGEVLGTIEIEDVLFAEHIASYTALTNSIASVLGLLIYNSRQYGKVLKEKIEILEASEKNLKKKNEELQVLYMELQASEEEIRSSNEELRATADELIEMNTKLERAKDKAEESDRLKTAFLQNMSHEIRTPLNAMLGFSSMLADNFDQKDKLRYFSEIINKRGNDLLQIIDGILDIAKIETGLMTVNLVPCNLGLFFAEIEVFFREYLKQIQKSHISFHVDNPFKTSDTIISTDALKLKQIFINLINNAIKFTNQGKIEVGAFFEDNDTVTFYVSDTGIGIPSDKHSEIFERFVQADTSATRLYGGTGLGLSIVKGLLNLLGGKIWLKSVPDKGSTFYFSIPFVIAEIETNNRKHAEKSVKNLKLNAVVLIVEDDVYNTQYLKEVLSELNCEVLNVSSGQDAVELSIKKDIDIVLMDIRLPDMNGFEATRLIKKQKPDLVIIAQTAYAAPIDEAKALESGCNDYLSKPIKRDVLLSKLHDFIEMVKTPH